MKRLFIYSMLVASSLGAMTSCSDFLDVKPVGAVSEEELLNQEGVNYAITGMYSSMLTQEYFAAPLTNYAYGDVLGGRRIKGLRLRTSLTLRTWKRMRSLRTTDI